MKRKLSHLPLLNEFVIALITGLIVNSISNKLKMSFETEMIVYGSLLAIAITSRIWLGRTRDLVYDFDDFKKTFPQEDSLNTGKMIYSRVPEWVSRIGSHYSKKQIKTLIRWKEISTVHQKILTELKVIP